jgi:plasmid maintenance system antidote protein VapI
MPPRAAIAVDSAPIHTRLKLAIVKSGIPQGLIADRLGISPFRLSRIVRGHCEATADEQDRLAELLGEPRRILFRAITR